jgi:hypothetical protein
VVPAMAGPLAHPVTHGRATVEVVAAQDRHRLVMVEAATPRAVGADIIVAEAVVVTPVVEVEVTPVVEAEATPAADIVDTTRTRSAS